MALTIAEALRQAGAAIGASEARALLRHALGHADAYLVAHAQDALDAPSREAFERLAARRSAGEPIAYLTGEREFYSLEFNVTPAVLIPRPETETLVDAALERIPAQAPCRVLDLATGSGCVAVAIARQRPGARVTATDRSGEALAVARGNAARHGAAIEFVESDWFAALAGRRFDLIVCNPPYVAQRDPHLAEGDLRFEPRAALVGGADGLACIRSIVAHARSHLDPGGALWFEHGHAQGGRCRALLEGAGYRDVSVRRDLAGIERVAGGTV
jgi:release factor glutamine methyltransferase